MSAPKILRFYLDPDLRSSAVKGDHNFIAKIAATVDSAGYRVEYKQNGPDERLKSATRRGYAMFHMDDPFHERALTFRRAYHYPFWAIENTAQRWDWRVARTPFDPNSDDPEKSAPFYRFWQNRLFGAAPAETSRDGFVYMPLQGRLLEHRSFQSASPINMIKDVLHHDPSRKIIATLHPNETYSPQEIAALTALSDRVSRFELSDKKMETCLQHCDYIVTQNSSAGFAGYFFGKPSVLFARVDFHHIAASVEKSGVSEALREGAQMQPDYAAYLHWYWQEMSINAGRPDIGDQIRTALERFGWPM
jgi:hypothetical protein